jgi:hypothetical protein
MADDIFEYKQKAFVSAASMAIQATNDLLDEADRSLEKGKTAEADEYYTKAWDNLRFIALNIVRRRIHLSKKEGGKVKRGLRELLRRVFLFGIKRDVIQVS